MRLTFLRALSVYLLTAISVAAQPRIGVIDFYGLDKVPEAEIRKHLQANEGGPLPSSKGAVEERLEGIDGILRAHLEAVCCDEGRAILYVGVEEKGSSHFNYREPPSEDVSLPEVITSAYEKFLTAVDAAARAGVTGEDLTRGHSLMADSEARKIQEEFVLIAAEHLEQLRKVLRGSKDERHRAIAAYITGYAPQKAEVLNDLLYALQDGDDTVRSNAMRALAAFAVLARRNPKAGLKISPTWMIEMLNSVVWSDRNNAAIALVTLTESRDESVMSQMRDRALPALIQMAGWKHLAHALPAYILLGRAIGIPEDRLQFVWSEGKRDSVLAQARKRQNP